MSIVHLTRTQVEVWQALRDNEQIDTDRMRRETIDALVGAGVAYERDSGYLCLSDRGRRAERIVGYALRVPPSGERSKT